MQLQDATGKHLYLTPDERAAFVAAANRADRPVRTLCLVLHTTRCQISLRHGYGVHAINSRVPLNMLQKWMGHAQLETTAIYANALGAEEQGIAARMWNE